MPYVNMSPRRKRRRIIEAKKKYYLRLYKELRSLSGRDTIKLDKPIKLPNLYRYIVRVKDTSKQNLKYSDLLGVLYDLCDFLNSEFQYKLTYFTPVPSGPMANYSYFEVTDKNWENFNDDYRHFFKKTILNMRVLDFSYLKHLEFIRVPRKLYEIPLLDPQKESRISKLRKYWYTGEFSKMFPYREHHFNRRGRRYNKEIEDGIDEYILLKSENK